MTEREFEGLLTGEFVRPELTFDREFGMHRNWWLEDKRVSGRPLHLFLWLVSQRSDFRITQALAQERMGWGRDAFLAARRVLEEAGYLKTIELRAPAGAVDVDGRPIGGHRKNYFEVLDPVMPTEIARRFAGPTSPVPQLLGDASEGVGDPETGAVEKPQRKIRGGFDVAVDNSQTPRDYREEASAEKPPRESLGGKASEGKPEQGFPPLNKTRFNNTRYSSSSALEVTHQQPPGDDDDGELVGKETRDRVRLPTSTAKRLREWHPGLDAVVLVDRLQRSGRLDLSQLDIERAVAEILQGSARPVGDPVAYISKAILAEPWRWARDDGQTPTPRGVMMSGSSRPPTAEECAERGHQWVGEWREACMACGAERPGWRDDRDRDNVEALRGVS